MNMRFRTMIAAVSAVLLLTGLTTANAATLRLVTNWGPGIYSVARTLEFTKAFNASEAAKAADLIVIGCHAPGVGDFLLGSNAARVVRHAGCSVYVVR